MSAMSATVRVLAATLFVTVAPLRPVSPNVHANPHPSSQARDVKHKVVTIAPIRPVPTPPACGRGVDQNYVFTFKTPEHYRYEVKGQKLVSGTSFPANGDALTITAVPDSGYSFGRATARWDYQLARARCGG